MTRDEEIAFNNFTDLFASLIAKHGREVPKLPKDKRKLLKRLRKYLRYMDNLFSEMKS